MNSPFFNQKQLELFMDSLQEYVKVNDQQMFYAMICAFLAHGNKKDKEGAPYYRHPLNVARYLKEKNEKIVAMLHDVLEDSSITEENLQAMGFSDEVITAVKALTRGKLQSYRSYLEQVCMNPLAKIVKLADIQDNINPDRLEKLDAVTRTRLKNKYEKAIDFLNSYPDERA